MERRKAFQEKKAQLAVDFLKELDDKVAEGRIGTLAESSEGIKIIWSKKLNSTAGRANWKRETLTSKDAAGASTKVYRHHASIELAEKVIDDEGTPFVLASFTNMNTDGLGRAIGERPGS